MSGRTARLAAELEVKPPAAPRPGLLVVEDDAGLRSQYRWAFPGFDVAITADREQALAAAQKDPPALVILDLGLPPDADGVTEGFATLEGLRRVAPAAKVIVVTGNNERQVALHAVARGAYDFCDKPVDLEVLRLITGRALRLYELEAENRALAAAPRRSPVPRIVTADEAMLKICRDVGRLAANSVPVLLLGASGTGKEALAAALHEQGPRARHPFVAINCGAIPDTLLESELFGYERGAFTGAAKTTPGKIEQAHKGTLFLDEIGDLPHPLQVKLLRVLQDQVIERIGGRTKIQVDVRIVSATNVDIENRVAAGNFRQDLLFRMNTVTLRIPALAERHGDAVLLANFFLERFNREFGRTIKGFSDRAVAALAAHEWPGNVRELENRVKRAVVMTDGKLIDSEDLELVAASAPEFDMDLRTVRMRAEHDVIRRALAHGQGNMSTAAKLLGISRPTLYSLLEAHGIVADAMRPDRP